jgi:predicted nucleotidyltransferase
MTLREGAQFELAKKLRSKSGATIAEVFTFLSGLYFRGKIAYANEFVRPAPGIAGVFVITPTRGLVAVETRITLRDLREFAAIDIDEGDPRYRKPLERSVRRLAKSLSRDCEIVLLGSIATGKYVDVLLENFRERLRFPADFVGRGDMSRGGLMLRCAADREELSYISVAGAVLNGKRPPKLAPRRYPKGWPSP